MAFQYKPTEYGSLPQALTAEYRAPHPTGTVIAIGGHADSRTLSYVTEALRGNGRILVTTLASEVPAERFEKTQQAMEDLGQELVHLGERELKLDMDIKRVKEGKFEFLNVANPRENVLKKLITAYNINPLDLEDFESKTQISKVEAYDNYSLIILDFPIFTIAKKHITPLPEDQSSKEPLPVKFVKSTLSNVLSIPAAAISYTLPDLPNPKKRRIFRSQVYFFIGNDYFLIIHDDELPIIEEVFRLCEENEEYRKELMGNGPLFFSYRLIDALVDLCFPILNDLSRNIEKIDRQLEKKKSQDILEDISITRRNLVYFHTIAKPLLPIFRQLEEGKYESLNGEMKTYWSNISDHVQSLSDVLEDNRELIEGISESNESLINSRNNEIIAFLTIIFTLTVPATVLGAFFGMNILLPGGLETGPYTFWGPYTTFVLIIIGSIIPILAMLVYFKYKKWI